ncbi:hypothetical protein RHMOL_Rhmol10G0209400 [Rhododendron molle]|uniref:Uncharacterized protein n=1 Tax=Rhododendron molle TaxID=49168 RepID=A0ACC0M4J2_RHOML|nr:hypothetical protein RHMOL_Rhmol10G0209400 [Rhododendron molle]
MLIVGSTLMQNESRKLNQMAMVAEKKRMEVPTESWGFSQEKWIMALKTSYDKIEKIVKEFKERHEKCKSFSQRRRFHDEKDIDSINDVRPDHAVFWLPYYVVLLLDPAPDWNAIQLLFCSLKPTTQKATGGERSGDKRQAFWVEKGKGKPHSKAEIDCSPPAAQSWNQLVRVALTLWPLRLWFLPPRQRLCYRGFAAGLPEKTVVWTANRDDPPIPSNATLSFSDGRLVLNITPAQTPYIPGVTEEISVASMLDSGNFVLYNSVGKIIWQNFANPTDTILPGQRLVAGQNLISSVSEGDRSSGLFRLKMQEDGHLVAYPLESPDTASYAYYGSGTFGSGNVTLNLDDKGHLYLLNETGDNIIKNITKGESEKDGKIYRMTLDADAIFRVYSLTLDPKGN